MIVFLLFSKMLSIRAAKDSCSKIYMGCDLPEEFPLIRSGGLIYLCKKAFRHEDTTIFLQDKALNRNIEIENIEEIDDRSKTGVKILFSNGTMDKFSTSTNVELKYKTKNRKNCKFQDLNNDLVSSFSILEDLNFGMPNITLQCKKPESMGLIGNFEVLNEYDDRIRFLNKAFIIKIYNSIECNGDYYQFANDKYGKRYLPSEIRGQQGRTYSSNNVYGDDDRHFSIRIPSLSSEFQKIFKNINKTKTVCIETAIGNSIRKIYDVQITIPSICSTQEITEEVTQPNCKPFWRDAPTGIILIAALVFLLSPCSFFCCFMLCNRHKSRGYTKVNEGQLYEYFDARFEDWSKNLEDELRDLFIPLNQFEIESKIIGQGAYATVRKGKHKNRDVCLKIYRTEGSLSEEELKCRDNDLFREILNMAKLEHENVLKTYGLSVDEFTNPIIILPMMVNADLAQYIRNQDKTLSYQLGIQFAVEISLGMDYLKQKKIIHRDLAARNCLLDSGLKIKIADFGLAKNLENYENDQYEQKTNNKLPFRWMGEYYTFYIRPTQ